MATINARTINQYKFKYHIIFSASFHKINEDDQRIDEIDLFINLEIFQNLTESEINNIDVKFQLEHQIQIPEKEENGWIKNKIKSMKIGLYKTGELNSSSYVKFPVISNAIFNIKNNDIY